MEGGHAYLEFLLVFVGFIAFVGTMGAPMVIGGAGNVNPDDPTTLSKCSGNGSVSDPVGCVQQIGGLFTGFLNLSSPIGFLSFVIIPAIALGVAYIIGRFVLEIIPG